MRSHGINLGFAGVASALLLASACSFDDGQQQIESQDESSQADPSGSGVRASGLVTRGNRFGKMYKKDWDAAADDGAAGSSGQGGAGGSSGSPSGGSGGTGGSAGVGTGGTAGVGGGGGSATGGSGGVAGAGGISSGGMGGAGSAEGGSSGIGGSAPGAGGTGGSVSGTGGSAGGVSGCVTEPSVVPGASGKSLFVALNGNDTTGDGSIGKPLRTLKKACSSAKPGDAVEVRGGTYNTSGETCSAKGTADHPIHVRPYAGEKVLYEASGNALAKSVSVIELSSASYVVLDGFEVAQSSGRGVFAYECTGVTLRNLNVHDTGYRGIGGTGQDLVFENNEVWNACEANANGAMGSGGWPAAIATYSRADGTQSKNVVIRNNHVHDSWGECIIALFADGMTIEGNQIHDCYSVSLYVDNSRNVRLERNQIWVTTHTYDKKGYPANGIMFSTESYGSGEPQQRIENLVIANNLITGTNKGISYWHGSSTASYNTWLGVSILHNVVRHTSNAALSFDSTGSAPAPADGVIANNVIWAGAAGSSLELGNPSSWQLSGNDWPSGKPATDKSSTGLSLAPGMVAPDSASDSDGFRLNAGSACEGKGVAAPLVTRDFWCAPRSPSAPSIGVHEP